MFGAFRKLTFLLSELFNRDVKRNFLLSDEANQDVSRNGATFRDLFESPSRIEVINGERNATRDFMMSLNIFGSTKVIVTLKSLAKTTSEIRDAKHRVLTAPNAIPNGFSRAALRHSAIPRNSDRESRRGDTATRPKSTADVKLKFHLRKRKREIDVTVLCAIRSYL